MFMFGLGSKRLDCDDDVLGSGWKTGSGDPAYDAQPDWVGPTFDGRSRDWA